MNVGARRPPNALSFERLRCTSAVGPSVRLFCAAHRQNSTCANHRANERATILPRGRRHERRITINRISTSFIRRRRRRSAAPPVHRSAGLGRFGGLNSSLGPARPGAHGPAVVTAVLRQSRPNPPRPLPDKNHRRIEPRPPGGKTLNR